jgi:hypothetical protein
MRPGFEEVGEWKSAQDGSCTLRIPGHKINAKGEMRSTLGLSIPDLA